MSGAFYVFTALLLVASDQIAAESGKRLQMYKHDVMAASNAVVKSLPNRFLRGSRDETDNLANEERTVYSVLASMINEGVSKMPCAAEVVEEISHTTEAVENMPRAAKAVKKRPRGAKAGRKMPRATKAEKNMPRAAEAAAVKKVPRAGTAVKKAPPLAEDVKEMPRAKEAMEELRRAADATEDMQRAKANDLLKALIGADEALKKHWTPSGNTAAIGDTSYDVFNKVILSLPEWKINFRGMKSMAVLDQHRENIDPVHKTFEILCDKNVKPTAAEVSFIWSMMEWKGPNPEKYHRRNLVRQAQRYVFLDLRNVKKNQMFWKEWHQLSESLKFGVLDYLLNLHYQRWVRMYNVFIRNWPDILIPPLNLELSLGGNTGTSSAMALQTHSKMPFNGASTSKVKLSVLTKRPQRTFNGNTDIANPSKMQNSKSGAPLLTESTVSDDHSVSTRRSKSSLDSSRSAFVLYKSGGHSVSTKTPILGFGGESSAFTPYKSSDHIVSTKKSKLSLGGTSSAFVPYKHMNVHSSLSSAPASTALTLKNSDSVMHESQPWRHY